MAVTYTKTEIYIEKTILEYDEFNNIISRNVYYDKEVKYNKIPPKTPLKIQPTIVNDKYYSYKLINSIPINTSSNKLSNTSPSLSMQTSPNVSPTSSMPPSPTDSVIIDMSNLLYSNTNTNYYN